jgi:hypothetical protein
VQVVDGAVAVQVSPLPDTVAVYWVTALPPLSPGAVHAMTARSVRAVAVTPVGASGTVRGVTEVTADAGPVPSELVAVTDTEYVAPFVSPVMVQVVPGAGTVHDSPEPATVAVYDCTAAPSVLAGADHEMTVWPLPGAEEGDRGAVGGPLGVTLTCAEAVPSPAAFAAVTSTTYVVPFVRPLITHVVAGALTWQDRPDPTAVAVYSVTAEPPSLEGALQLTVASPSP